MRPGNWQTRWRAANIRDVYRLGFLPSVQAFLFIYIIIFFSLSLSSPLQNVSSGPLVVPIVSPHLFSFFLPRLSFSSTSYLIFRFPRILFQKVFKRTAGKQLVMPVYF